MILYKDFRFRITYTEQSGNYHIYDRRKMKVAHISSTVNTEDGAKSLPVEKLKGKDAEAMLQEFLDFYKKTNGTDIASDGVRWLTGFSLSVGERPADFMRYEELEEIAKDIAEYRKKENG